MGDRGPVFGRELMEFSPPLRILSIDVRFVKAFRRPLKFFAP